MAVGRLVPAAGLGVDGRDDPVLGHFPGDAEAPVVASFYVLAGHQGQQVGGVACGGDSSAPSTAPRAARASWTSSSTSASRAARSSQSQGGWPGPCGFLVAPRNYHALTTTFLTEAERRGQLSPSGRVAVSRGRAGPSGQRAPGKDLPASRPWPWRRRRQSSHGTGAPPAPGPATVPWHDWTGGKPRRNARLGDLHALRLRPTAPPSRGLHRPRDAPKRINGLTSRTT